MRSLIVVGVLLVAAVVATSLPPKEQTPSDQANGKTEIVNTTLKPLVVELRDTAAQAADSQRDRDERLEQGFWTTVLGKLTFVLGVLSFAVYVVQANRLKETIDKMDEISKGQSKDIKASIAEAARAATAMEGMSAAMKKSADAAKASADALMSSERAYIALSHSGVRIDCAPDGDGGMDPTKPLAIALTVHINNSGRTPGTVVGGFFGYSIGPKPTLPDVTRFTPLTSAFLANSGGVQFSFTITVKDEPELAAVILHKSATDRLWFVGEVEYRDRFRKTHIGGYGRAWVTDSRDNPGLNFVPETGPWNFDALKEGPELRDYERRRENV